MNLWLCGTFCVALWSAEAQSVSSCWVSAHLVLWDLWNIKKSSLWSHDSLDKPSHATRRNPGQDRHDFNRGPDIMSAVLFLFHKLFPGLCFFADEWPRLNCFLIFYHCTTSVAGSLIEILDCQGLSIFHRRGWLLFAFALWCVAERRAQAAIFQGRLHFDSRNKSRLRIPGCHLSIFLSFLIRQSAS